MARNDPDIKRMWSRFVCVRITRMNGVNLRRFDFDYDTTWNAFFLDEQLNVYSRFGGRDESDAESRLNKEALLQTMQEVLDVHQQSQTGKSSDDKPSYQPIDSGNSTPESIPLLKQNHRGCVHCHQVREYGLLQSYYDGRFERRQLFPYPLPENLGLQFDRKHGHKLHEIIPNSAASNAGLQPGDLVTYLNDVPIHSEYDVRWALHRAAEHKLMQMVVERLQDDGTKGELTFSLRPSDDWRQTELGWRMSLRSVPFRLGFRAYALGKSQRKSANLPDGRLALRVISVKSQGLGSELRLQKGDFITSVAGRSTPRSFAQFTSDLLRQFQPGDTVRVKVLRDGKLKSLAGTFPSWSTEKTSVP